MATPLLELDTVQATIVCRAEGQFGLNVRHWIVTALTGVTTTDQNFATGLSTTLSVEYRNYLPLVASFYGVKVQILGRALKPAPVTSQAGAGAGEQEVDLLPTQASLLAKLTTPFAGRRFRGRIYLPFWPENMNSENADPLPEALNLASNILDLLTQTWTAANGADNATLQPVIYHRDNDTTSEITGYVLREHWATQRRRSEIGRGDAPPF